MRLVLPLVLAPVLACGGSSASDGGAPDGGLPDATTPGLAPLAPIGSARGEVYVKRNGSTLQVAVGTSAPMRFAWDGVGELGPILDELWLYGDGPELFHAYGPGGERLLAKESGLLLDPALPILPSGPVGWRGGLTWSTRDDELWWSDGTPAGTKQIAADVPGAPLGAVGELLLLSGDGLYSVDVDGQIIQLHDDELQSGARARDHFCFISYGEAWVTDGTVAGTVELTVTGPKRVRAHGDRCVFETNHEHWVSDGTAAPPVAIGDDYQSAIVVGDRFFYVDVNVLYDLAGPVVTPSLGVGPRFVGTAGSALLVANSDGLLAVDPDLGTVTALHGPGDVRSLGEGAFAVVESDRVGVYTTDGSVASTVRVDEVLLPSSTRVVRTGAGGFFETDEERRLWNQGELVSEGREVYGFAGGFAFLFDAEGQTRTLRRSDGVLCETEARIHPLLPPAAFGDSLAYGADDTLHACDGGGSRLVETAIVPYTLWALTGHGEHLYFAGTDGPPDSQLWRHDGETTVPLGVVGAHTIRPAADGVFVFGAELGRSTLWWSDGSVAGARKIVTLDDWVDLDEVLAVGSRLYFTAYDETHGHELWTSDGTEPGTRIVRDINPAGRGPTAGTFAALGDHLFFEADDGVHGKELWKTDGTEEGTVMVADLVPGRLGGRATWLRAIPAQGVLVFTANNGVTGAEAWATDGTTVWPLADLRPGMGSSAPHAYQVVGDTLIFAATPDRALELWQVPVSALEIAQQSVTSP